MYTYLKSSFSPPPFLLLVFFLLLSCATAFNITEILNQHSEFSTFNGYLTETKLADEINKRETITVLAVDNGGLSSLSGKSMDVIRKIMSYHVVLDYFDASKLLKQSNSSAIYPTLYQASGQAAGQQGFMNVTRLGSGEVAFGPATPGATLGADLVKSVVSHPFNISVLQISSAVMPSGLSMSASPPPASPPPAPAPTSPPPQAQTPPPPPPPPPTPPPSPSGPAPEPSASNKSAAMAPTPAKTPSPPPPSKASPPAPPPPSKLSPPSPPPSEANATAPSPSQSPSDDSPPAPPPRIRGRPMGPPPTPAPAPSDVPVADAPAPADSTKDSKPADHDRSSAPAAAGIHLAVVILFASILWSFT